MNFIQKLLLDKKKLFGLIALLVIVIAIPVVVIVSQRQQEIRQRASGEEANLFFTKGDENPISQINLEKGKQGTIAIYVNTGTIGINSFDVKVSLANILNSIENITVTEADAGKFENSFFKEVGSDGTIRFSKGSVNNSVTGTTRLGLINFNVKASANTQTADIGLTKAEIASPDKTGALSTNQLIIPSSIVDPASSPTSSPVPTETPTSTPNPQATSTPTSTLTPTSTPIPNHVSNGNFTDDREWGFENGSSHTINNEALEISSTFTGSSVVVARQDLNLGGRPLAPNTVYKIMADAKGADGTNVCVGHAGSALTPSDLYRCLDFHDDTKMVNKMTYFKTLSDNITYTVALFKGNSQTATFDNIAIFDAPDVTVSPTPQANMTLTPTQTITSTSTPTLPPNTTATPTSSSMIEDINHDNLIDINDFNIWLDEFKGILQSRTADINNDGRVDLVDYNIWFIGFKRILNQ